MQFTVTFYNIFSFDILSSHLIFNMQPLMKLIIMSNQIIVHCPAFTLMFQRVEFV